MRKFLDNLFYSYVCMRVMCVCIYLCMCVFTGILLTKSSFLRTRKHLNVAGIILRMVMSMTGSLDLTCGLNKDTEQFDNSRKISIFSVIILSVIDDTQ